MVNSKEFAQRLHEILDYYGLSASAFARRIGVQPSGISHLLSGRNKPSLDFILKVVEHFPEVDLYWLLNGKGSFPSSKAAPSTQGFPPSASPTANAPFPVSGETSQTKPETPFRTSPGLDSSVGNRKVNQVIVCYSDGSFESYRPAE